jgi:hypothetical protein
MAAWIVEAVSLVAVGSNVATYVTTIDPSLYEKAMFLKLYCSHWVYAGKFREICVLCPSARWFTS